MKVLINKFFDFVEYVLSFFLKIGSKLTKKDLMIYKDALMQFIKFGIVGLSNTIISYFAYILLLLYLKKVNLFPNVDYLIAQVFSFLIGVLWSFLWNNIFVFKNNSNQNLFFVFFKVLLSYSFTGLILNSLLLMIWVNLLHISQFIAPIINLLVSVPLNFILNKKWAFKD